MPVTRVVVEHLEPVIVHRACVVLERGRKLIMALLYVLEFNLRAVLYGAVSVVVTTFDGMALV